MYCRKCGTLLDDTDQNCRKCGEPTGIKIPVEFEGPIETAEEVVFNSPNTDIYNKNLIFDDETSGEALDKHKEAQRKERKYIEKQDNNPEQTDLQGNNEEFVWDVHEFTKPKKNTEDIEFNWRLEDYNESDIKENTEPILEETLFREIKDESKKSSESKIDRFYTFNKKNEEFQKLLDKEYERLKGYQSGEPLDNIPQENLQMQEIVFDYPELTPTPLKNTEALVPELDLSSSVDDEENVSNNIPDINNSKAEHLNDATEPIATVEVIEKEQEIIAETPETPKEASNTIYDSPVPIPISQEPENIEEQKDKKNRIGRVILTIIAIILAVEIAILGIRYFAPNSVMAKSINNAQTQIINIVAGWINGGDDIDPTSAGAPIDDGDDKKDEEDVGTPEIISEPDPKPMSDKAALISSQMGNNKNIINVRNNEALAYQAGRDYGSSDINNSKPIENNIWKAPEGEDPVYYDQSIVGTIISFDSQWIDYVNGGSDSVFNLLKQDSKAYKNAVNFSKLGKVKEIFQLLEIGDIRKGSEGYYVWTYEEIQITEKGRTYDIKYNWIYHLEPVDGEMKIVNYIKY